MTKNNSGVKENYCAVCLENVPSIITLKCKCNVCEECLTNWAVSNVETNILFDKDTIPCPMDKCKLPMNFNYVLSLLTKRNKERASEEMLQKYLTNSKDVRRCPGKNCSFAGIIPPRACKMPFECSKCKNNWTDEANLNFGQNLKYYLTKVTKGKNEYLSNLVKIILGNDCPGCGRHIIKNGGCPHMVCQTCKYEFCWMCLGSYKGYRHEGIEICGFRVFFWFLFFILSIILVDANFTQCFSWYSVITTSVLNFFKIIGQIFAFILCFFPFFLTIGIYTDIPRYRKKLYHKIFFTIGLLLSTGLLGGAFYLYNYWGILKTIFIDIAYIIMVVNIIGSIFALIVNIYDASQRKYNAKNNLKCAIAYALISNALIFCLYKWVFALI